MSILKHLRKKGKQSNQSDQGNQEEFQRICQHINTLTQQGFAVCAQSYESHVSRDGIYVMEKTQEILTYWQKNDQGIFTSDPLLGHRISEELEQASKELLIIEEELNAMHREEKSISEEIINFSNVVAQVSSKYKLSPTWEGKKPILIEKQKQLEQRKAEFEAKEKNINTRLSRHKLQYKETFARIEKECSLYIEEVGSR